MKKHRTVSSHSQKVHCLDSAKFVVLHLIHWRALSKIVNIFSSPKFFPRDMNIILISFSVIRGRWVNRIKYCLLPVQLSSGPSVIFCLLSMCRCMHILGYAATHVCVCR